MNSVNEQVLALPALTHPFTELSGMLRVGHTRVALSLIIREYRQGATAEAIHESFPTVSLADIYKTLAFYSAYPEVIDAYVAEDERLAEEVRVRTQGQFSNPDLSSILDARLKRERTA